MYGGLMGYFKDYEKIHSCIIETHEGSLFTCY